MIRISTGTEITLITRIALHLSYSDLTTPDIFTPNRFDIAEIPILWEWRYIPLKTPLRGSIRDRTHDVA